MIESTLNSAVAHAKRDFPKESCGLVVVSKGRELYVPCENMAGTASEHFKIGAQDYARAEDLGAIIAVVHSHPNTVSTPSQGDRVSCEASGLEWHIISIYEENGMLEFKSMESITPTGYEAPLEGRTFCHGILDCYSIIKDYYERVPKIILPQFERPDNWWNKGLNLYQENFEAAGFVTVTDGSLKVHDILYMQIRAPTANHAAVYLGNGLMLHHFYGRLSSRDVYGGYWADCTVRVIRHKDFV